jgi:hypothetical protein
MIFWPPSCGTDAVGFSRNRLFSGAARLKRRPALSSVSALWSNAGS